MAESRLSFCTRAGEFSERVVPMAEAARRRGLEVLDVIDRHVARGFLPPAPRPKACVICDFRPVCGPDEEVRVEQKDRGRPGGSPDASGAGHEPVASTRTARERIRTSLDESWSWRRRRGPARRASSCARLVAVLAEGRGTVQRVVAVTFTEKAAGELKLRLRAALEEARQATPAAGPAHASVARGAWRTSRKRG